MQLFQLTFFNSFAFVKHNSFGQNLLFILRQIHSNKNLEVFNWLRINFCSSSFRQFDGR